MPVEKHIITTRVFAGKVEFFAADEKWHPFHDSNWTEADADVACKDFGFPKVIKTYQHPKGVNDSVVCKDYTCSGREPHLIKCSQSSVDYTRCANKTIAGVECKDEGM